MAHSYESPITECPGYVRVEFGDCSYREVAEVYRAFAAHCVEYHVSRALLKAGDDDPDGHYALRDALKVMGLPGGIAPDFKLALLPRTRGVEAVYRETQQQLRAAGFNAWVFGNEVEAVEWLEDRAVGGRTAQ
jgi:hypothetical protein